MSAPLWLRADPRPFERIPAELACVGIFSDERPLVGPAARADWRLCGLVSELLATGRFRGAEGEALLLPSHGRLASSQLLVLGLGSREQTGVKRCRENTRAAVARAAALGARRVAFALPGVALDDLPRHARALVEGADAAVRAAEAQFESALGLQIPVEPSELARFQAALESASLTERVEVERWVAARPVLAGGPAAPRRDPAPPALGSQQAPGTHV